MSINPRHFATRPDWIGRLRRKEYGTVAPRSEVLTLYQFPEHLHRWLKVFGDEAGRTPQEAAAFAIEEGCRTLLSIPAIDTIDKARAVIDRYGTPLQHRSMKTFAFDVARPEGYVALKKVSVRVPVAAMKNLTAVESKLRTSAAPMAILIVLIDVLALPGPVREQLYQEAKRFIAYLDEWAEEAGMMVRTVRRRRGQEKGSEVSMGDLLATVQKAKPARKHAM